MLARWIATVAALLLACAQASAHVRAERAADLGTFVVGTEHALEILRSPEKASPGDFAQKSKTAPPARASLENSASGENAPLTHCHVWENWSPLQQCASGVHKYLYGNGNPGSYVDPTGQYAEAGHYYTTYYVALRVGYSKEDAATLALYSQLPDEVGAYDAINKSFSTLTQPVGDSNLVLSPFHQPRPESRYSLSQVHGGMHSLTGDGSKFESLRTGKAISQETDLRATGILIHRLGDTYAHRGLKSAQTTYGELIGHGLAGHTPDEIHQRPELYRQYVKDLANQLYRRRTGERLGNSVAASISGDLVSEVQGAMVDSIQEYESRAEARKRFASEISGVPGQFWPTPSASQVVANMGERHAGTETRITERFAGLIEREIGEELAIRPENVESGMTSSEGDEVRDLRNFYQAQGIQLTEEELEARADELERAARRATRVLEEGNGGEIKAGSQ